MEQGRKAEIASEFVNKIVADTKSRVLSALLDDNCDVTQARADYKTAIALLQRITNVINTGKSAEHRLKRIEEEENGREY